jgi:hypothetical protein
MQGRFLHSTHAVRAELVEAQLMQTALRQAQGERLERLGRFCNQAGRPKGQIVPTRTGTDYPALQEAPHCIGQAG